MGTTEKTRITDTVPPVISIASPQDGSPYSSAIEMRGTVKDLADKSGTPGKVASLSYQVQATTINGSASVAPDGTFDFTFLAASLHGAITVTLTATDWNGNKSQASVGLIDSGNGIPGFTATASSGTVTLTWPSVPLTDHYDLYYETSNAIPSPQFSKKVSPVSSGYTMSGLSNGNVYSYLLESIPAAGSGAAPNWSAVQMVIPLSQVQLVPVAVPGHSSIQVSWTPIAASVQYQVWKGTSSMTSTFVNVSGNVSGTTYTDSSVAVGQTYYYAVKPAQYSQVMSWPTSATPDPFPTSSHRELANVTTHGYVSSPVLSADGNYLYVVDSVDGIVIYNVSNPANPVRMGTLPPISQVSYIDGSQVAVPFIRCAIVSSQYIVAASAAYDADNDVYYGRVSLIDVSNPSAPQEVSYSNTGTSASSNWKPVVLAVSGAWVFVAEQNSMGAKVDDLQVAGNTLVWKNSLTGVSASGMDASSSNVYVAFNSQIQVLSYNGTSGVLTLSSTYTTGAETNYSVRYYSQDGVSKYLYVGNSSGFRVVSVTGSPLDVGSLFSTQSAVYDIWVQPGTKSAYVSTNGSGLYIYNVATASAPFQTGTYPVAPSVSGSVAVGSDLFVTLGGLSCGFKTVDVAVPLLTRVNSTPGAVYDEYVAISDRYAYVTCNVAVDVFDLNAAGWPSLVSTNPVPANDGGGASAVSGNILVVGTTAFLVYDITNPTSPSFLASLPVYSPVQDIKIRGSYAYVACRDFGLTIIDVSTPSAPKQLGSLAFSSRTTSIQVSGTTAYVLHGQMAGTSLAVVDVSDPLSPRLFADNPISTTANNSPWGSALAGNFLYLCLGGGDGLAIYDVTNPLSPVKRPSVPPPSPSNGFMFVAVQGEYAYASIGGKGIVLIDIGNPLQPYQVAACGTNDTPMGIAVRGGQVVAASGSTFHGLYGYLVQ